MRRCTEGFSLIEAVVAIAIMAILASAALPLLMKSVNQQAEQTTRANAQIAYNAIFGARDHRVSNLIADFGYALPASGSNLRDLVNQPAGIPAWQAGAGFSYGWNGPYWTGSVTTVAGVKVPADAWGRPFVLVQTGANWQVVSGGEDGNTATIADNIVYPPAPAPAVLSTLSLVVTNNRAVPVTGTILVSDRNGGVVRPQPLAPNNAFTALANGASWPTIITGAPLQVSVNPGPVTITVSIPAVGIYPVFTTTQVIDLLPGQNFSFPFQVY